MSDRGGSGFDVSTEFTIEVRGRSGRLWDYSSERSVGSLEPSAGDLADSFDLLARDRFERLRDDVRADGYDGPDLPAGNEITWAITDAARAA